MWWRQFEVGPLRNFSYLVADTEGGDGVVIDPSFDTEPVLRAIDDARVRVRYILNTHGHRDHYVGNTDVQDRTGARVVAYPGVPFPVDQPVRHGDRIESGRLGIEVLHAPGHTRDSVLYLFEGHVATGDTLFVGECGRVDLPESDPEAMYDTLLRQVIALDDGLVVLPGHNYGPTPTSTIGREKRENYTLQPRTREEFRAFILG